MTMHSVGTERREVARERRWFLDLEQGTGAASGLGDEVRRVLQLATVDTAADLAFAERSVRDQERRERARAEQQAQAARALAAQRQRENSPQVVGARTFSTRVLIGYGALLVTALGPWIIGTNWLRDTMFRQRSHLVYSTTNRDGWAYFATDYLAGAAILTLIAGVAVGLASLVYVRRNVGRLITAGALVFSTFVFWIPAAASAWSTAELETVRYEAARVPPGWEGCAPNVGRWGKPSVTLNNAGIAHTWTALVVETSDDVCDRVQIWDGVRLVRTVETPNIRSGFLAVYGEGSPENIHFVFAGAGPISECEKSWCHAEYEVVGGFSLADGKVAWQTEVRVTAPGELNLSQRPAVARTDQHFGAVDYSNPNQSRVLIFDPATGDVKWSYQCPRVTQFFTATNEHEFLFRCRTDAGLDGFYITAEGELVPE